MHVHAHVSYCNERELPLGFSAISIAFSIASSEALRCTLSFGPLRGQNPPLILKHIRLSLSVCLGFRHSQLDVVLPGSLRFSRALCGMPDVAAGCGHTIVSVGVAVNQPESSCYNKAEMRLVIWGTCRRCTFRDQERALCGGHRLMRVAHNGNTQRHRHAHECQLPPTYRPAGTMQNSEPFLPPESLLLPQYEAVRILRARSFPEMILAPCVHRRSVFGEVARKLL